MTRIDPTSSPRSIPRANRSTSTDVFPVPAPAETKTTPSAWIAASCSGVGGRSAVVLISRSGTGKAGTSAPGSLRRAYGSSLHPAHRREPAPRVAAVRAKRVVADVAAADPLDDP